MTLIEFLIFYCVFTTLFAIGRLYTRRCFLSFKNIVDVIASSIGIIYMIVIAPIAMPFYIGAHISRKM